jgi:hypothetical protein
MANGTLKVSNIETSSGSGTITLGQSGETVDLSNATTTLNSAMKMTPAFEANLGGSGGQSVSDNTVTLVTINTEVYDTDSAFDTSTYRFTPQTAGKYFAYASIQTEVGSNANLDDSYLYFKLNGSNIYESVNIYATNYIRQDIISGHIVVDMNGSSDYLELYGRINSVSGSGQLFESNTQWKRATHFGAYRIIGA